MKKISFTQQKQKARNIKNNLKINEILNNGEDYYFLLDFFKHHPNYNEKFTNGCIGFKKKKVKEWGKNNECLFLIDKYKTENSISINFTKKLNKKAEVLKAFRQAIYSEIKEFKKTFKQNKTKCALSGNVISNIDLVDVDHYNYDFIDVVSMFLNGEPIEDLYPFLQKNKTVTSFSNKELIKDFIIFHNKNTHLRFVLKKEHQKRKKNKYTMFKPRDYQEELSSKGAEILRRLKIVYYSMEVRTGKSFTALMTAEKVQAKNVLFLTKKKAIQSIQDDYNAMSPTFDITIINDESMHKLDEEFDLVIHDEHHRFGAFPKAGKAAKLFKEKYSHLPMIFLSGTPHPESYSQIYHQFWVSKYSPFAETSFYKWAKNYVTVRQKSYGRGMINDYSDCNYQKVKPIIEPYMITYTQKEAGFTSEIVENVLTCKMKPITYSLCDRLKKDLVIKGTNQNVVADTAVKLMQKLHQMYSGTIKFEDGSSMVIDYSKAEFIKDKFKGKKIGIFYKFIAELKALKEVFGDSLTTDVNEFDTTDKNIALQIVSGREGISLRNADYLVFYNIDFSATSYWQARDRMTTKDRLKNTVYWVFSEGGIEYKIYRQVKNKKSFTSSIFKKEYNVQFPKQSKKTNAV